MQTFTSAFISLMLISIIYIHFENKKTDVNYVVSKIDGRKYLVQNHADKQQAADNLATIRKNLVKLVQELKKKNKGNVDIERMVNNFNPNNISESTQDNKYTSYSVNKGEKIVFCLRSRDEKNNLVELNTMMFVALHELAHTMTKSIGHTQEFWDNFRILINISVDPNVATNPKVPIYKEVEIPITKAEYNKLTKEKVKNVYDAHLGRTDRYKEKLIKEGVPRYTRLKQTDEIIGYKYEVKDLPDVDVVEYGGEELTVSFPNAYRRSVTMEYTPPKGTKDATFRVDDAVPESGGFPGDVPDFYAETVDNLDEVYGGASRIEQKVLKLKKPRYTQGDEVVDRAEAQYDVIKDRAEDLDEF